jgi:hypothetical protein
MQRRKTKNKIVKPNRDLSLRERLRKRRAFVFCMVFATFLGVLSAIIGSTLMLPELALGTLLAALAFDFLGVVILMYQMIQDKKNSMHEWALAESEKQEVLQLRGNTEEELHRMLDYHLKTGNIQEADAISHKLLALVDKDHISQFDEQKPAVLQITAGESADVEPEGLPDWMKAGDDKAKTSSVNLPSWMQ